MSDPREEKRREARVVEAAGDTDAAALRRNIVRFFTTMGWDRLACRAPGCGRTIWMVRMPSGKFAPYTDEAVSHFADCPGAKTFKGTGKAVEE